jgi:hypothetical protein
MLFFVSYPPEGSIDLTRYSKHFDHLFAQVVAERGESYANSTRWWMEYEVEVLAHEGCLLKNEEFDLGKLDASGFALPQYVSDPAIVPFKRNHYVEPHVMLLADMGLVKPESILSYWREAEARGEPIPLWVVDYRERQGKATK